ncbi:MAG: error-prone polymerase [Actinomycetota bacterium]|nr:error-prone polymerase [Actinomycetota bacterium]
MSSDPFVHLHVASGYSMRYGASHPHVLAQRAAEHGMDTLALTDRDGTYGAVKFVQATRAAGIRPVLGVDLAIEPSGLLRGAHPSLRARGGVGAAGGGTPVGAGSGQPDDRTRTPARGGASVDLRHPRVTLLAQDRSGWAALCRLVSATHLRGERGAPVTTLDLVAEHVQAAAGSGGGLLVLLGPTSEVGRALLVRRPDLARAVLSQWRDAVPVREDLLVEVVSHRGPDDVPRAARMLGFAADEQVTAVLTNAVRYADRLDAPTADVLDASRRLVALDARHIDRVNAEGYLKSGKEMHDVAEEITRAAGLGPGAATALVATTRRVSDRCAVDPRADLGIGEIHFPELSVLDGRGGSDTSAARVLRERCETGLGRRAMPATREVRDRLEAELGVIETLGFPSYFLTVADVVDLIRDMGVRAAARGSGAGSLVNYLLGISGVDPIRHGLLMERFLSPLRIALPDIDIDVESARRTEVYERILERFGGERVACVSMMDTYRVRHAIRDVGAALGMPPGEIDAIAKAFPHIRARDVRLALAELPELRASHLNQHSRGVLDLLFRMVERLDGLPRHIALHPCGVLLSDTTLLDRTPVEASWLGFPMSQFDKDDVEELGLLKLDVLGIRMQSAMAHAVAEVVRLEGGDPIDLDDQSQVPLDDPETFRLVQSTRTLGMFQIESPGQRELVGKFAPETFGDLITDISLFRPGPVKSDMVTPFLLARQGWREPVYLHDDLRPALEETCGVVVFHEQVLQIIHVFTGVTLAQADEKRRELGSPETQPEVEVWFRPRALARGYDPGTVDKVWEVLKAFASFGFCKAHAAAFALPTFQSAWLKAHHPAAFLAGVLTHDPGMYPKRLILDDARQLGITVLPLDVNLSDDTYRVEKTGASTADDEEAYDGGGPGGHGDHVATEASSDDHAGHDRCGYDCLGAGYGIRLALTDVKGISAAEVARIVAARPFASLADFWHRASVSRPVVERLVLIGAFDALYSIGARAISPAVTPGLRRRGRLTRRDLLLQVAELDRWTRAMQRGSGRGRPRGRRAAGPSRVSAAAGATRSRTDLAVAAAPGESLTMVERPDVRTLAARQSQAARPVEQQPVQLALDLGDEPADVLPSGLPEMSGAERVRAELEVLGLDVSRHVIDFYADFLDALAVTRAPDLVRCRSKAEVLVAGVKVATQTPPIRSGKRVVFVTLDDARGPVDATFFEDAQGPYAATLFHSWLLVIRGEVRRTGPRGVSLRATGCWELTDLYTAWRGGGLAAVAEAMAAPGVVTEAAVAGAAESRSTRPVMTRPPVGATGHQSLGGAGAGQEAGPTAGGMGNPPGTRRVLVHASGFRQSPYADIKPPGDDAASAARKAATEKQAPRKLWHSSPGSPG